MKAEFAIEVREVSKLFEGIPAVDKLTFQIPTGAAIGFIGTNGAGKTTTMRMLATLETPDNGAIYLNGINSLHYPGKVRKIIGWMPDSFGVYPNTLVREYIDFFARSYGLKGPEKTKRITQVMGFTGLDKIDSKEIDTLSKGMRQRLCLGRMLLSDPDIIIMDEPAAGLDPEARIHLKKLVRKLNADGKTILISSHILSELEDICDRFMFLHEGNLRFNGNLHDLKTSCTQQLRYRVRCSRDEISRLHGWAMLNPGVEPLEALNDGVLLSLESAEQNASYHTLKRLIDEGFRIQEFTAVASRLEDVFVELVGKNGVTEDE